MTEYKLLEFCVLILIVIGLISAVGVWASKVVEWKERHND